MNEQEASKVSTARFCIKTQHGEIEAEGPVDFIERRWDDVQSILNRVSEVVTSDRPAPQIENEKPQNGSGSQNPRRQVNKKSGPSCAARIAAIDDGKFFQSPRKASDVAEKLAELATPYEGKHVSAALIHMTKTGKLRRLKAADSEWAYINP